MNTEGGDLGYTVRMDWNQGLKPILDMYRGRPHPLEHGNSRYHLLVMVLLSAQDSDRHINEIAPELFATYPTIGHLAKATREDLRRYIGGVVNIEKKSEWLLKTAKEIGSDAKIPQKLDDLIKFSGIGRKSANVIIRESRGPAEGVIVDLHVLRCSPRIGVSKGKTPEAIEKDLMKKVSRENWGEVGMAISFLGREICRPTPKCGQCPLNTICHFYTKKDPHSVEQADLFPA